MRFALPAVIATVLLAGCTVPGTQPTESPSAAGQTPATAPASATPSARSAPDLPVLASRKLRVYDIPATINLNEVAVRGGVTTVSWSLHNDKAVGATGSGIQMNAQFFGDGQIARVPGTEDDVPEDSYYVDGVSLIDTANKVRYLPARDSNGVCVCSYAPSSQFIRAGGSLTFSAVFKAVPEGVNTVDVSIPRVGIIGGVPVQR